MRLRPFVRALAASLLGAGGLAIVACESAEVAAAPDAATPIDSGSVPSFGDSGLAPVPPPARCECDGGAGIVLTRSGAPEELRFPHGDPPCVSAGPSANGCNVLQRLAGCAGPSAAPPCLDLRVDAGGTYVDADGGVWSLADASVRVSSNANDVARGSFMAVACAGSECDASISGTFELCSFIPTCE